ncbi:glycosyltransferase [Candidatus Parcubacteria bacterium]|nr:glycosyltransferase [Candidatus Parcubacteria bacterium]
MAEPLKILMISSDRSILVPGSAVSLRMKEYGALVGELHIVLLSDRSHGLKEAQIAGNVRAYPTNSFANIFRPLDAARIGKRIVKEKGFVRGASLITAQDPFECGWAALQIKKRWRLPLEVQIHTDIFSPYFSGFQNRVRKFFARKVLASADAVRVVSEELKGRIAPMAKAPVSVLPIYVDRERIEGARLFFDLHARYPWRFIALAVSRLSPEKDLGTALAALALVRKSYPDLGLLVVGNGPEEGRLKALARKLGLEGGVEFVGWQDDLTSFYRSANVFVQTSLFEGYGLSLVEAGLSGLPVITTPVGIARELENGRDALFAPPGRADLFAEAIAELVEHNQKRESLRANLKRTLESKLLSKESYLESLAKNWSAVAHFSR